MLPENYRPIALTNHISKIFESILRESIIDYLVFNNVIDESQHGSLKGKSTTSQLLKQIEIVINMLEDGSN